MLVVGFRADAEIRSFDERSVPICGSSAQGPTCEDCASTGHAAGALNLCARRHLAEHHSAPILASGQLTTTGSREEFATKRGKT